MSTPIPYRYEGQIRSYIAQFMRIFSGFQWSTFDHNNDGTRDLFTCPVFYGDIDRVVSHVLNEKGSPVAHKIPLMTGYLQSLELRREDAKNKRHIDTAVTKKNGVNTTVRRPMGVPYRATMDLTILASSTGQMMELLEQILVMFSPDMTMIRSANITDPARISRVELVSLQNENNFPAGEENSMMSWTLTFTFDFTLLLPKLEMGGIIETIEANMLDNTFDPLGVVLGQEIVTE